MITNYFKIAFRNVLRSKAFSFINVLGISVGMAASILILFFIAFETGYDSFHKDSASIYRIALDTYRDGALENKSALTPPALGKSLFENYTAVENFARIASNPGKTIILYQNKSFNETKTYIADPSLFEVFSFEWSKGSPGNLFSGPYDVVISEMLAEKIFGSSWKQANILDETVDLRSDGITGIFKIKGVFKNLPVNSHFHPELFAPRSFLNELVGESASDQSWDFNFFHTYIKLKPGSDAGALRSTFNSFVAETRKEALESAHAALDLHLQPLRDIHLKSNIQFELENNGDIKIVYALGMIGFIILIVAWINFINLSTARSLNRAKEVGIRKVLGAQRKHLIIQFIVEAVLLNLMSLGIALGLVEISKPYFSEISGVPDTVMNVAFLWSSPALGLTSFFVLCTGIVLSGLYPAFVLSSFNPIKALKAHKIKPSGISMRQALVVLQSSLSLIMISGTFVIYKQINFMRSKDLGINIERTLVVEAPEVFDAVREGARSTFKFEALNQSFVKGFTMSSVVPGQEVTFRSYNLSNEKSRAKINCGIIGIDSDFIKDFKLELLSGKNFSETLNSDSSVILNEEALEQLGFNSPEESIGAILIHENRGRKQQFIVEGVVKNYHHRSLRSAIEPIMFKNGQDLKYYSIKIELQAWNETERNIDVLGREFKKYFPGNAFNYFFLDQQFDSQYKSDQKFGTVFLIFSVLALIISSLGLLALSTFMVSLRRSEIGIRKVFGASTASITCLLLKDYLTLLFLSTIIGVPVIYFSTAKWLSNYSFKIEMNPLLFMVPVLLLMLLIVLTIGIQSLRAAWRNPIDSIKAE